MWKYVISFLILSFVAFSIWIGYQPPREQPNPSAFTGLVLENIGNAFRLYKQDCNSYPSEEFGVKALKENLEVCQTWTGPYLEKPLSADYWGNELSYKKIGDSVELRFFGPNKKLDEGSNSDDFVLSLE